MLRKKMGKTIKINTHWEQLFQITVMPQIP